MNPLYKEHLLEIYSSKKNFGNLENKTHESKLKNPICDDEITIELEIKEGKVISAKFNGKLCFVSTISAEVLIDNIIGMDEEDLRKITKEDMDNFLKTQIIETRVGCEIFPLEALKNIKEIVK